MEINIKYYASSALLYLSIVGLAGEGCKCKGKTTPKADISKVKKSNYTIDQDKQAPTPSQVSTKNQTGQSDLAPIIPDNQTPGSQQATLPVQNPPKATDTTTEDLKKGASIPSGYQNKRNVEKTSEATEAVSSTAKLLTNTELQKWCSETKKKIAERKKVIAEEEVKGIENKAIDANLWKTMHKQFQDLIKELDSYDNYIDRLKKTGIIESYLPLLDEKIDDIISKTLPEIPIPEERKN
ncbi:hypothetical protein [Cardinium endosymbiont of Philonthus spinipes]|uniref:hypothetical protein n=1 Tax=Cardinium endosymbiont of Philonthus spinipes TaxID=3077941 RepID=UPI00313A8EF9